MTEFWRTLADFICVEIQGFPFTFRENQGPPEVKRNGKGASVDSTVNRASSSHTDAFEEDVLDPLDAIPENSLKHMLKLPKHFERIMCYSLSTCMDALLFELTLMPIQAVGTLMYVVRKLVRWLTALYKEHFTVAPEDGRFPGSEMCFDDHNQNDGCFCGSEDSEGDGSGDLRIWDLKNNVALDAELQTTALYEHDTKLRLDTVNSAPLDLSESESPAQHTSGPADANKDGSGPSHDNHHKTQDKKVFRTKLALSSIRSSTTENTASSGELSDQEDVYLVNPNEACGCVRFFALVLAVVFLSRIDTSRVYHNVRGQPFFKLYVIFNMLEICERLCRSFGRDCTDNLMRTTIKIYKAYSNFDIRREKRAVSLHREQSLTNSCDARLLSSALSCESDLVENCPTSVPRSTVDTSCSENNGDAAFSLCAKVGKDHGSRGEEEGSMVKQRAHQVPSTQQAPSPPLASLGDLYAVVRKRHQTDGSSPTRQGVWLQDISTSSMDTVPDSVIQESSRGNKEWETHFLEFLMRYLLVIGYIIFHSFMHLVRVLSLNIAINSSDSAMFLLLVTNNFAEIKTTVFKKYNETSLFTIVAMDTVERFHLCFDVTMVFFKMCTVQSPVNAYVKVLKWLTQMLMLEMLIDYFKHSFLLKFNKLPGEILKRYTEVLMGDILLSRCQHLRERIVKFDFRVMCKGAYSFSHIPSRRLGFMPSPIVTLIICNIPYIRNRLTPRRFLGAIFIWLALFFLKITMSILLVAHSIKDRRDLFRLKPPMDTIGAM
ncbi:eukaryotic membrane protein, putative [Babesia caballi]|uniref:Eukaryotic membrane protein, putative n=1 Tax=Babesia caballi TaxID=5871 RepID=A0AAV4LWI1_BABCB|nr:eukaryotic membrane protein, putative [Babesia caballi]